MVVRATGRRPACRLVSGLNALSPPSVDPSRLRAEHERRYSARARLFSAPGRVNLIGEHTDYNDGFVLPMAIERRTFVSASARTDSRLVVHSLSLEQSGEIDLAASRSPRRGTWLDFIEGTARVLPQRGFAISGANLLIDSDVPAGAGLSASAALELALGFALATLGGTREPDRVQLALAGQTAEHEYVGTRCGIMDQYVVALGQKDRALLIDCRSLGFDPVPLELGSACILICDTRVKHELSSSGYNERRAQCEQGVALIQRSHAQVRALRDVTPSMLGSLRPPLPAVVEQRCRHVVSENERTLRAARALEERRLPQVGALMSESHASLRDLYQVSCPELDEAVSAALDQPGVHGARMTGGGFGGCTVALLEREAVDRVSRAIGDRLRSRFGAEPRFFATTACDGVREDDT